jgi:hypothetical protein
MPSWIECDGGHLGHIALHEVAIALSKGLPLKCQCGKPFHPHIHHRYANVKGEKNNYKVIRVARLYADPRKHNGFDPFLLLLRQLGEQRNERRPK